MKIFRDLKWPVRLKKNAASKSFADKDKKSLVIAEAILTLPFG
jgi:hypothetical protein